MSRYQGYTEGSKLATIKYRKEGQKQINFGWKKAEFEDKIAPAIAKSGLPMATFIKAAVLEKIERDKLSQ